MPFTNPFRRRRALRWQLRDAKPRPPVVPTVVKRPVVSTPPTGTSRVPLSGRDDYTTSGDSGSDLLAAAVAIAETVYDDDPPTVTIYDSPSSDDSFSGGGGDFGGGGASGDY